MLKLNNKSHQRLQTYHGQATLCNTAKEFRERIDMMVKLSKKYPTVFQELFDTTYKSIRDYTVYNLSVCLIKDLEKLLDDGRIPELFKFLTEDYDLSSPFDARLHAMKFIDYLEVIILPDGTIEYAVPSHQEKLKAICIAATSEEEFNERKKSPEAYVDSMQWLCNYSGCISVWNTLCVKPDVCTPEQLASLKMLSETNHATIPNFKLYRGEI
jgi:hypothetical protein